jgi:two-component system sensor histidine kinase DevS
MTRVRLSPATRLVLVAIAGLFVASAAVWAATAPPWLGVGLRADTDTGAVHVQSPALGEGRLVRLGGLDVEAQDLVEEVDYLPDYTAVDRFFQRQSAFLRALQAPTVALEIARAEGVVETVEVTPGERPLSALPSTFWLQLVFGLSGLFIGGWVWALRSKDLPALMFALTGLGMLAFSTSAGIYSTRELTLGGPMFRALSAVNHAGAMTFGAAMIALFLVYPRRVARPWMLAAIGLLFAVWLAVDLAHLVPSVSLGASGAVTIQMLLIVAAIGVQWFANRGDPVGRAALRWLGLSVIVGAGSFIALSVVPPLLGAQPLISQGYAFGFFVLIYAGLAIGLRRHRLFALDEWAFLILFYALGVVCLLALDAALVLALQLSAAASLTLALAVVALLYLPLRDGLWRRFVARRKVSDEDLFGIVVETALAPQLSERAERWRLLLQRLFDPSEIRLADGDVTAASIVDDGLAMILPPTAASPALSLRYPWRGRGLFGPAHLRLAQRALQLMDRIESGRQAYERGRSEERKRIAHDLHDDVGALLLSSLHKTELAPTRQIIRDAISDIRGIVDELTGELRPLGHALADLRFETAQRLEDAGLEMEWPLPDPPDDVLIEFGAYRNVRSALREIVSNAIRHSGATRVAVRVEIDGVRVSLEVEDNGRGMSPDAANRGLGLRGLERRVSTIGGSLAFPERAIGVCVRLEFNLAPAPVPA